MKEPHRSQADAQNFESTLTFLNSSINKFKIKNKRKYKIKVSEELKKSAFGGGK